MDSTTTYISDLEESYWIEDTSLNNVTGYFVNGTYPPNYRNDTEIYNLSPLPWWRQLIWSFLFGPMVIVATVGNLVVIWIVLAHKRMRTVTNYLLVNLSIADTMVSTINVIPNYIYMSTQHWPFGTIYCKLVQFVAAVSICASTFTLMAIAFDRYSAIMNPLKPRMGRKLTLGIAAGIWVGGIILSTPNLIFFTTFVHDNGVVTCYGEWPDGSMTNSFHEYLYNVFFMIFTYFLPIFAMGYTYARVGVELWGSQSIGEATQRQLENIKSKRRVVKMMMVVVTIFAICWFPFQLYFIMVSMIPDINVSTYIQEIFLGVYWLAMSNSMYNPIIYCWMNARFRRGFQQVFSWCPFVSYVEFDTATVRVMGETRRSCRGEHVTRYSVTGSPEMHMRIARNGGSNVHIPLHVLTNKINNGKSSTHLHPSVKNGDQCNSSNTQTGSEEGGGSSSGGGILKTPSLLCINQSHQHSLSPPPPYSTSGSSLGSLVTAHGEQHLNTLTTT